MDWIRIFDLYEISNSGLVRSIKSGKLIKDANVNGYRYVHLSIINSKGKNFYVHRLVAIAFIENPENKPQVNHKNGIKHDNSVNNLEWCTPKENNTHKFESLGVPRDHGKASSGQNHPNAILTLDDARDIYHRYHNKLSTAIELSKEYGLNRNYIYNICSGMTWKSYNLKQNLQP